MEDVVSMMACLVWCVLTVTLTGIMLMRESVFITCRLQLLSASWLGRFLRGEVRDRGEMRIGIAVAAILWWCGAAGVLVSDVARAGIVIVTGCALVVALLNVGIRAALPALHCLCLAGILSTILVLLYIIGGRTLLMFASGVW